jgi:hypothetical protein
LEHPATFGFGSEEHCTGPIAEIWKGGEIMRI